MLDRWTRMMKMLERWVEFIISIWNNLFVVHIIIRLRYHYQLSSPPSMQFFVGDFYQWAFGVQGGYLLRFMYLSCAFVPSLLTNHFSTLSFRDLWVHQPAVMWWRWERFFAFHFGQFHLLPFTASHISTPILYVPFRYALTAPNQGGQGW